MCKACVVLRFHVIFRVKILIFHDTLGERFFGDIMFLSRNTKKTFIEQLGNGIYMILFTKDLKKESNQYFTF
jgi:hypothetical protein